MSCAKRMIVVGDEKQLPNVVPEDKKLRAMQIGERYSLDEGYQYEKFSLLTSVLNVIPRIRLKTNGSGERERIIRHIRSIRK